MKFIKLFSILFYLFCITRCNELFPDDKLSIKPISYEGNELKINGYYYQHHYLGKPGEDLSVHVLFRNGIVRYIGGGYKNFNEIEVKISDPNLYDGKTAWGIFVINRDVITFEQWHSGMGGGLPVFFREGKILNDTTFHFTAAYRLDGTHRNEVEELYHFRQFSIRPDSTSRFIP